jgi:hypothetical protein
LTFHVAIRMKKVPVVTPHFRLYGIPRTLGL